MARPILLLSLVTALVLPPGGSRAQPAPADSVTLGFCWPPGMKADVTASSSRAQTGAAAAGGTVRYTLEVLEEGEHLRVRLVNPIADLSGAKGPVTAEAQSRIDDQLSQMMPDYLVTRTGRFVGLFDVAGYQARVRALVDTMALPPKVDRAAVQKAVDATTSEAALNARLSQEWHMLVTAWLGSSLAVGVEQTRPGRVGASGSPGMAVTHTYAATARVPCRRGGEERGCVQLDLRSVPDADALKAQSAATLAALGRSLPASSELRSLEVEESVRLVTEIDCLIPHSIARTRTQRVVMARDGKEQTAVRTDRTALTYAYP